MFVLRLDVALNPNTITTAQADNYAEGYDVEVFAGPSETYVSGSIEELSNNWPMGNFGLAPPGALHGFIQVFDPTLAPTCNYVHVLAINNNEFFKMVDLEENVAPVTSSFGLISIGGNMNHSGPVYDFFTGCAPAGSIPFSSPVPQAGFALRVDDAPLPVWGDISTLTSSLPAPVVLAVSNFEEDIFVGGHKLTDAVLTPSSVGDLLPSLGSLLPNAYFTYIYSQYGSGVGDFRKTATSVTEQAEEEQVRFAVYPNPANDVFYLRIEDDVQLEQVILKDLAGRDIRFWNGQEAAGGLSIGDIPAGIYFLEVEGEGVRATERVVIQ
ncbi:MAG: T9SS type A sorting domain-containing protein [Leptolyngbya sp. SIO3F4]|nr:T9SS type A sorting domain-containing protein [Leptolyngbya sp. SIO3F4]